ncbi:DUF2789 family protein [Pelomonas sp. SE-A7]|uniref:DUF2789 family protein n=1 Tax=Pelomonas sp. SE-A7 TaxID=3054953 RepID=UPI00259CD735|nr:DUF2789 family protein [Pelomonas sp. SE-A7]MDM4768061.1 DUF2789 family protein [Pelomonas sp. SE-A7]
MESPIHSLVDLFKQLGLPHEPAAIEAFIAKHRPQCQGCAIQDAPMWTPVQASFLREAIEDDADWAIAAESLTELMCR